MEEIRKSLYAAKGKGARKRVMALADDNDRLTLGHEIFPEKCLNFIIEVLSTMEAAAFVQMEKSKKHDVLRVRSLKKPFTQ